MKNSAVWLIVAGVAAYFLYKLYATVSNLTFVARGLSVGNGGISLQLGIQNVSSSALQFNGFTGSVLLNGSSVGNVSDFTAEIIQPSAETQALFFVTPNLLGLASQAVALIQGGSLQGIKVQLQGAANVNGQTVPVQVDFN